MKTQALAALAAAALIAQPVIAQQSPPQSPQTQRSDAARQPSQLTRTFVTEAERGGKFEIESSNRALTKASNPAVKQFAQRMIDDHTAASQKLKDAAKEAGITAETADLSAKQAAAMRRLDSAASGTAFDRAYAESQVQAHQEAVALFRRYAERGENDPLKQFARSTLPTLEDHLKQAQALQGQLGGSDQSTSKRKQ